MNRILLSILVVLVGCTSEPPAVEIKAPPVHVTDVVARDLDERIEATGELRARLETVVAAEVSGKVTHVRVEEGAAVESGAALLEIDPERRQLEREAAEAGVAQARASYEKEKRQTDRMRKLHRNRVASKQQLDEAELALQIAASNLAAQRAQLDIARRALEDATVRAPFAGVAGQRYANLGQFVQPGTPLLELIALDPLEVVFHLAEVDSGRVRVGQVVEVDVAPFPDERFRATVDVIFPSVDRASRTLRVKAVLPNPDRRLRPGLFARADLGVARREAVPMIPEEAVLQRSDGAVVFRLVDGDRVERRRIEIGAFREGRIEVRDGLAVGDVVVIRGHTELVDGAVVRVRAPDPDRPVGAGT